SLLRRIAAGFFVIAGALYFLTQEGGLSNRIEKESIQILSSKIQKDLGDLKNQIELEEGRSLSEVDDESLKEKAIEKIQSYSFVPQAYKDQFANISAPILRIFLEEPQAL